MEESYSVGLPPALFTLDKVKIYTMGLTPRNSDERRTFPCFVRGFKLHSKCFALVRRLRVHYVSNVFRSAANLSRSGTLKFCAPFNLTHTRSLQSMAELNQHSFHLMYSVSVVWQTTKPNHAAIIQYVQSIN